MAEKSFSKDVVILKGPPYVGKTLYYKQTLSSTHNLVCPADIYRENNDFGLRDVCLQIYGYLKKGEKVVVEDDSHQHATHSAYISAVKKKFPKCKLKLVRVEPQFGECQCHWAQQYVSVSHDCTDNRHNQHAQIERWFLSNPSPLSAKDKPDDEDNVILVPLTLESNFKLEVPALFLQWEALNTELKNTGPVAELIQQWSNSNRCGRVIVICDGKNVHKGFITQKEEDFAIKSFFQTVVQIVTIPVYVMQLIDLHQCGGFTVPPEPGVLAYLQKRHCLSLHCRSTQYVYTSSSHKTVAEKAGVRHIKISTVLHRPNLLASSHNSCTPRIPDMLKHLVVQRESDSQTAEIPLYNLTDSMQEGQVTSFTRGMRESLFATSLQVIQRYQEDYADLATPIEEKTSNIQRLQPSRLDKSLVSKPAVILPDVATLSSESSTGSTGGASRGLPSWMLGKSRVDSVSSLSKSDSTSSTEGRRKKNTVYVMTEKELLETAKQILKQGGREDLIDMLERREEERKSDAMDTVTPVKDNTEHHMVTAESSEPEDFDIDDVLAVSTLSTESPRKRRPVQGKCSEASPQPSPAKKKCPEEEVEAMEEGSEDEVVTRKHHVSAMLDSLFS